MVKTSVVQQYTELQKNWLLKNIQNVNFGQKRCQNSHNRVHFTLSEKDAIFMIVQ